MFSRIVLAALVVGFALPSYARAAEPQVEAGLKLDFQLQKALASPVDKHGIPQDLYDLDAELAGYKATLEQTEGTAAIQGIGGAAFILGGIAFGIGAPNYVWAPFGVATGIPWGYAIAGLGGVVELLFLGTLSSMGTQLKQLQDAYAERYQSQPAGAGHSERSHGSGGVVLLRW